MYSITTNKHFIPIFFKNKSPLNSVLPNTYNLIDTSNASLVRFLQRKKQARTYISNIYLAKYTHWVYVYLYVYRFNTFELKYKHTLNQYTYSHFIFYQLYLKSKTQFLSF